MKFESSLTFLGNTTTQQVEPQVNSFSLASGRETATVVPFIQTPVITSKAQYLTQWILFVKSNHINRFYIKFKRVTFNFKIVQYLGIGPLFVTCCRQKSSGGFDSTTPQARPALSPTPPSNAGQNDISEIYNILQTASPRWEDPLFSYRGQ